jgi:hypothetical protein
MIRVPRGTAEALARHRLHPAWHWISTTSRYSLSQTLNTTRLSPQILALAHWSLTSCGWHQVALMASTHQLCSGPRASPQPGRSQNLRRLLGSGDKSRQTAIVREAPLLPLSEQLGSQVHVAPGFLGRKSAGYRQIYRHLDEVQHWRGLPGGYGNGQVSRSIEVYRDLRAHRSTASALLFQPLDRLASHRHRAGQVLV